MGTATGFFRYNFFFGFFFFLYFIPRIRVDVRKTKKKKKTQVYYYTGTRKQSKSFVYPACRQMPNSLKRLFSSAKVNARRRPVRVRLYETKHRRAWRFTTYDSFFSGDMCVGNGGLNCPYLHREILTSIKRLTVLIHYGFRPPPPHIFEVTAPARIKRFF